DPPTHLDAVLFAEVLVRVGAVVHDSIMARGDCTLIHSADPRCGTRVSLPGGHRCGARPRLESVSGSGALSDGRGRESGGPSDAMTRRPRRRHVTRWKVDQWWMQQTSSSTRRRYGVERRV